MTLADVNVLLSAFRADSIAHERCRSWLNSVVDGESRYGISTHVLSGVVRIATHPRVFARPSELKETLAFCDAVMAPAHCVLVQPGARHWSIFCRLCKDAEVRGNLVPDAWFAALAIESGCEWITLDRDYARFPELKWRAL